MKRRFFPWALLCCAMVLSLSACGEASQPTAPDVSLAESSAAQEQAPIPIPFRLAVYPAYTLHPILCENRANLTLSALLYEGLFILDDNFQPQPLLCSSYTVSDDGLRWVFTLRSGVTFSDGTPLSGEHVASTLHLARQSISRYAQRLQDVSTITAGVGTITIALSRPNPALPTLLDIPIALGEGDRPLGTGPYVLHEAQDTLSLRARSGWWQGTAVPSAEIPLLSVSKTDDLISAFGAGDVGLVAVDFMGTNALGYSGNYESWDYATSDLLYLGFNTQTGLCRTPELRRALSLSIDRDSIVQRDYARHAAAATLPIHPNSPLYDKALATTAQYDPEELATRLSALGVLGRELELVINSENSAKVAVAQRIAYQLEAAGMRIKLRKLPFEDYLAALTKGSFDLYLGEVVLTADFDLSPLLRTGAALNYGQWQDPQTQLLLDQLRAATEQAYATAATALYTHLTQQAPIAPICFKNGSVLTQWGRLSGLSPVRGNVFFHLEDWMLE